MDERKIDRDFDVAEWLRSSSRVPKPTKRQAEATARRVTEMLRAVRERAERRSA